MLWATWRSPASSRRGDSAGAPDVDSEHDHGSALGLSGAIHVLRMAKIAAERIVRFA
jgi:hypothetical protein